MGLSSLLSVLQNGRALPVVDGSPEFDLLQGAKAAEAGIVIVQAAMPDAGGDDGVVFIAHPRQFEGYFERFL
jgi:hypothetical protein